MNSNLKYLMHFLLLTLLQVFLLNNINISGLFHPFVYLYVVFLFPYRFSRTGLLLIAFITGALIDVFSSSYGLNTIAMTAIGFIRPYLMDTMVPDKDSEEPVYMHIESVGIRRFLMFLILTVFIHHLILYFTESFTFTAFFFTLLKVLVSTVSSVLIIFVYELLFFFRR